MINKRLPILVALLALSAPACGSDDASASEHDHQHGEDGEHDHYTPGMRRLTEQGLYEVALYSDPGPPAVGLNVLSLGITDAAGGPVTGATVTVVLDMPAHGGHGSDRDPDVDEEPGDKGIYKAENVSLTMMGIWRIVVGIDGAEGPDVAEFRFDVQ